MSHRQARINNLLRLYIGEKMINISGVEDISMNDLLGDGDDDFEKEMFDASKKGVDSISPKLQHLFIVQYFHYTKKILDYTHSDLVSLGILKRIVLTMDKDIKDTGLRIKPSTVKSQILSYVESVGYDDNPLGFSRFKETFYKKEESDFSTVKLELADVLNSVRV
ncbi:MAG: hypothetical protein ACJAS1_001458 [Oleiphilaceae bacterium]